MTDDDERSLSKRLKEEERFYREAGSTKGPLVHHTPARCNETADLLKEAREAIEFMDHYGPT